VFYGLQLLSLDIGIDRKFFWDMSAAAAAAAGQEVNPGVVVAAVVEVEWAECACCGLREECTPTYAAGVRARYGGRWLCGLCGEAVGEELAAAGGGAGDDGSVVVEVEAAIARHAAFCRALGCRSPAAAERLIAAVRRLLRGAGEGGRKEKAKAVVVLEFHDA
jgi:hypothetical protein